MPIGLYSNEVKKGVALSFLIAFLLQNTMNTYAMSLLLRTSLMFLLLLTLLWAVGFAWYSYRILQWHNYSSIAPFPTHGIAVTGGRDRIAAGLTLLEKNEIEYLFISGVSSGVSAQDVVDASGFVGTLTAAQMRRIELGYMARTTFQNAKEIAAWAEEEQLSDALFITSSYHMPRSLLELSHQPGEVLSLQPYPISNPKVGYEYWWRAPNTLRLFLSEYHKYCLAFLRGLLTT